MRSMVEGPSRYAGAAEEFKSFPAALAHRVL
jgi:hypothetical protein